MLSLNASVALNSVSHWLHVQLEPYLADALKNISHIVVGHLLKYVPVLGQPVLVVLFFELTVLTFKDHYASILVHAHKFELVACLGVREIDVH